MVCIEVEKKYGPNVTKILISGSGFVVKNNLPNAVRKQLMIAVKNKILKRFKKEGLKPEVFFSPEIHPDFIKEIREEEKMRIEYISSQSIVSSKDLTENQMNKVIQDRLNYIEKKNANN